jgi:predicted Zn-dependent protease
MQPHDGMIKSNLGSVLLRLNRVREAILVFEEATAASPSEPVAWFNLGNARVAAADWTGAVEAYNRTLALRPDFPEAQQALAHARGALSSSMAPNVDVTTRSFAPPADSAQEPTEAEQR